MGRILILVIAVVALNACEKKNDDNGSVNAEAADKLTTTQWCTVNKVVDNFQVVTRFSFGRGQPNKANISYLRLSDGGSPIIYHVEKDYEWIFANDGSPLLGDRYTVELIEDDLKVRGLSGLGLQKAIFDEILKKNVNLKHNSEIFSPMMALRLKQPAFLSSKDSEQTLFPCSSYSTDFAAVKPVRPFMEFNIFFGQSIWLHYYDLGKSDLILKMSLNFPLEQLNTSDVAVEGSSWCSWLPMKKGSFTIDVLTFGKEQFAQNHGTDLIFKDGNNSAFDAEIENTKFYKISENKKYLRAEAKFGLSIGNSSMKAQEMLTAMQDADGTMVLVKMNPYRPDLALPSTFSDIYFKCDNPGPLEINANIKKNLPKLIELQKKSISQTVHNT